MKPWLSPILSIGVTVSMVCFPTLVNAAPAPLLTKKTTVKKKAVAKTISVDQFIEKILSDGDESSFGINLSRVLGFSGNPPTKGDEVKAGESGDDRGHICDVVLEMPGSEDSKTKPLCLFLAVSKSVDLGRETYRFRLRLDGSLEKAFLLRIKQDENGKTIRGSGVKEDLDIASPEVIAMAKRELDFWLKRYSQKPAPAAAH
ncbi:MAG: hypothetical protein AAB320_02520 [Elusimicrobiota bacterium]